MMAPWYTVHALWWAEHVPASVLAPTEELNINDSVLFSSYADIKGSPFLKQPFGKIVHTDFQPH